MDTQRHTRYEAREWLDVATSAGNSLAPNRFGGDTKEAVDFINNLYRMGAVHVEVLNLGDDGVADQLHVTLPTDSIRREGVLWLIHKEMYDYGIEYGYTDKSKTVVEIWWD